MRGRHRARGSETSNGAVAGGIATGARGFRRRAAPTSDAAATHANAQRLAAPVVVSAVSLSLVAAAVWLPLLTYQREILLVAALTLAALVVPIARGRRLDPLELGVAVAIAYFALFPLRAAVVLLDLDPAVNARLTDAVPRDIRLALATAAVGILAGGLAYLAPLGAWIGARIPTMRISLVEAPTLRLALPVLAVGLVAQSVLLAAHHRPDSFPIVSSRFSGFVSAASVFMIVGLALVARRAAHKPGMPRVVLALAIAATLAIAVAGQFKEAALIGILVPLAVWSFSSRQRLSSWKVVLVAVVAVAVVFPLVSVWRQAAVRLETDDPAEIVPSLPEQAVEYEWVTGGPREADIWIPVRDPVIVASHRLYGFDSYGLAVAYTGQTVPFQNGATLSNLAAGLIPRVLWADKPNIGIGYWFADEYWGTPSGTLEVPQAVSHPGELWINFGFPGVVVGLALLGVFYRVAFAGFRPRETGTGALLYTIVFVTVVVVDRDLPLVYVTLVQRLAGVALFLAALVLVPRLLGRWRRGLPLLHRPLFAVGRRVRQRHVMDAVRALPAPATILDAGSGDGRLAAELAAAYPNAMVMAIDVDDDELARAERRAADVANLEVTPGAVGDEPLRRTFDLVVCVDVLEHIEDDRAAVEWLLEHLASNGWLVLHVPARQQRHWLRSVSEALTREIEEGKGPHLREGYGREDVRALLDVPSVNVVSVRSTFHSRVVQLAEDLDSWMHRRRARPLKALLLPLLLAAAALERRPSRSRAGNGVLVVARRAVAAEAAADAVEGRSTVRSS